MMVTIYTYRYAYQLDRTSWDQSSNFPILRNVIDSTFLRVDRSTEWSEQVMIVTIYLLIGISQWSQDTNLTILWLIEI